jgi:hypothetical protein
MEEITMATKTFEVKSYAIKVGFELSGGGGGPRAGATLLA